MASQNPGDKSTELSVRTQDMLGDLPEDEEEEDDDLSEQMSYDDHEAPGFNDTTVDHVDDESDNEDDDLLVFEDEETVGDDAAQVSDDDYMPAEDQSVASQDSTVRDIDAAQRPEASVLDISLDEETPQAYRGNAHGTLRDLIEVYGARNQVSSGQYERSLRQLHAKWESVLEQAVFEHEQNLDSVEQERHEMELDIEELRRAHENELEASKAAVMEQSQKIILEEMKLNADQEVRACRSEEAVEETRREMSEDFEIALEGMKTTQEEMKTRYEKLVKDTEVRVRDEVENEIEKMYTIKSDLFQEIHEELKKELLEQALQIQTLEMKTGKSEETDELTRSLENEVKVLRNNINVTKSLHQEQIENLKTDKKASEDASARAIDQDTLMKAVEVARVEVRKDMTDEFDIVISGMKKTNEELTFRYEKLVEATEIRVRDEVYAEAKEKADRTVQAIQEQYSEVKTQIIELAIQVETLEVDVDTKTSEIELLGNSLGKSESKVDELTAHITSKNRVVGKLESDVESKSGIIIQLGTELETKSNEHSSVIEVKDRLITELKSLSDEYEVKLQDLNKSMDDEIQALGCELAVKLTLVGKLEMLVTEKEIQMKKLKDDMELINDLNGSKNTELVNHAATLEAAINEKQKDVISLEGKIKQLGEEMLGMNKVLKKKDKLLQRNMTEMNRHIEELNADLKLKDEGIKELLAEMDSIEGTIKGLGGELKEKNVLIETKDKMIEALRESVAERDSTRVTKEEEIATMAENIEDLEAGRGTNRAEMEKMQLDFDTKLQDALYQHQDKVAEFEANVKGKEELFMKQEIQHQLSLSELNSKITSQYEAELQTLKSSHVEEQQVKHLQAKYNAEIHNLHQIAEEERARSDAAITEHGERLVEIERLRKDHEVEIAELKEKEDLQNIVIQEMESHLDGIETTKRDHQSAIVKLEAEHSQESAISLKLIDQLRSVMTSSRSVQSENGSTSSPKRRTIPVDAPKSKIIIGRLPMNPPGQNIDAASRGAQSQVCNLENISEGQEIAPTTLHTPEKAPPGNMDDGLVSPLTMTSPLAKGKKAKRVSRSTASLSRTPQCVPKTVDTNARRKTLDKSDLDTVQSVRTLPATLSRSTRRTPTTPLTNSSSVRPRTISRITRMDASRSVRTLPATISRSTHRNSTTPLANSSSSVRPRTIPRTTQTVSSRLRSFASPKRSAASVAGSVTKSVASNPATRLGKQARRKPPSPPPMLHSDLDGVQMRSREGLFSCEAPLPQFGDIKLLILNVPVTDRRKKFANALNIEIVCNPLKCTHAIVGDADNHIRRTAKLMAALCVTPNILRSEWLDDCYKHRLIMSTSHHTLLNDYLAEKAYAFSMKNTIREGNERRKYDGLLNGWRIMICDSVAGNKAPKEDDLKMMVAAAGGEWLESSNTPVPLVANPAHVIVITSDPATSDQLQDEKYKTAAVNGAGFFTIAWLFDSMMHQKLFGIKRGLGR